MISSYRFLFAFAFVVLTVLLSTQPSEAIPYFAHEFGMTCQKCHSVIPRLTPFGAAFMDHGYALPGAGRDRALPISGKANLVYTSEPDPSGLPKALVDEIELFVAGKASPRTNYFIEHYVVDGGRPGATREAWLANRFTPNEAKIPVYLQVGEFGLPLPIDPETFRETNQHYSIWDQTVGANPFNFFDPKIGAQARVGYADRGTSGRFVVLQGHDKQSGLPSLGTDTMVTAQHVIGPLTLSAYRYDGSRPTGGVADRFYRQGYGAVYASGKWESDTVVQVGHDSDYDGNGNGALSSGGFTQLRYEFDRRMFALVRYDGANDPLNGLTRDLVPLLGYRVSRNSRFTIEDVVQHVPQTKNTLSMQYTVGY